jgi:MFS family permease
MKIGAGSPWRVLALLAVAEVCAMSVWLAPTAVMPELQRTVGLSASQSAWLAAIVQLGFVLGTLVLAVLNVADIVPARWLFAVSAAVAALANLGVLASNRPSTLLAFRFATGIALAGAYPPAMKMAATWFLDRRGLAIGVVVGALTLGKALPYAVSMFAPGGAQGEVDVVLIVASCSAVLGGVLIAWLYHDGPHQFPARPFSWARVGDVLRPATARRITLAYLGHMWELYAYWSWIAIFLAASERVRTGRDVPVHFLAFIAIAIGVIGAVWGGLLADRIGRARVARGALMLSGACSLLVGAAFGASRWILVPIVLVWGVSVIADSAQFSALITEAVPSYAVGTALTLQTSLGFFLTLATIHLVPRIAAVVGWRWSFAVLALGPMAGIAALRPMIAAHRAR